MEDRQLPGFLLLSFVLLGVVMVGMLLLVVARFGLGALALFAALGLYFLVAHVALPLWVYLDARRNGRAATAWAAATFFVPVVVAPIYFFFARDADAA